MRDVIAEHSAGKYVGWIMGLWRRSRETYDPSEHKDVEIQFLTANPAATTSACPTLDVLS